MHFRKCLVLSALCHIRIDFLAGGIDYSQWREKAQNLFSDEKEPLSVTGTKTGIKSDETRTFWSTAPPKVDHDKAWGHKFSKMFVLCTLLCWR